VSSGDFDENELTMTIAETRPHAPAPPPSARDRLLSTAGVLFYKDGYRGVGIDRVIAESGVAKATFYKHFPSKDDLIVAWIERAGAFGARHEAASAGAGGPPLLAVFDAYLDLAERAECLGCAFQGTAAEFPDPGHPAHAASLIVKRGVIDRLEALAQRQSAPEPRKTAEMLYLLLEGVWASVRMFRAEAPIKHAREAARKLIR
jgi:AcrR family transcriptional regulator